MPNPARFTAKPNVTTNFVPARGDWDQKELRLKESVAMSEGAVLVPDGSGQWTISTTTSTVANVQNAAILCSPIAATDADYATDGKTRLCWVPRNATAEFFFTVGSGTFTTADVGNTCDFAASTTVAVDTATYDPITITDYISSTRGIGKFTRAVS